MARSNTGSSANWLSNGSAVLTVPPILMAIRGYLNNTTSFCNLLCLAKSDANEYHCIAAAGGGSPSFRLFTNDGSGEVGAICSANYSAATWYVVGAAILSATERYIWMNGASEGSSVTSKSPTLNRTSVGGLRNEDTSTTFGALDGAVCEPIIADLTNWGADAAARKAEALRFLQAMVNGASARDAYVGQAAYWRLDGYDSPEPDLKKAGGTRYPLTVNGTMPRANNGPFVPASAVWWRANAGLAGPAVVVPGAGDVRLGVTYDSANLPIAGDVRLGVVYG